MKIPGFIGPSYTLKSVNVNAQRCVNMYPELIEGTQGKNEAVAYLKSTPGLQLIAEIGEGPIRCIHQNSAGEILVVSGDRAYRIEISSGVWTAIELRNETGLNNSFLTETGIVYARSRFETDGFYTTYSTIFVDGSGTNYIYEDLLYIEAQEHNRSFIQTEAAYTGLTVENATHIDFIDGYYIRNKAGTGQFYVSDLNSFVTPALSFATAEGSPDNIVGLIANRRDLWLFGERTTELFVNTGNVDFPFERAGGGFIEKGCLAPYSIAKGDGAVFWLGRDEFGQGVVYVGQSLVPQRISTHAVEYAISTYSAPQDAKAFTYQMGGHLFYVLNFAEATWVFDASTQLWHERAYSNNGTLERHRADLCFFMKDYNMHVCGDYETNKIYKLDENYFTDNGVEITRLRTFPHFGNLNNMFCQRLQLDMNVGNGIDGSGQGMTPQVMLDYSDDGGNTWSSEQLASSGSIGVYKSRVIWRRLGKFRDRVFRVKITDPVDVSLINAEIYLEPGAY